MDHKRYEVDYFNNGSTYYPLYETNSIKDAYEQALRLALIDEAEHHEGIAVYDHVLKKFISRVVF